MPELAVAVALGRAAAPVELGVAQGDGGATEVARGGA